MEILNLESGTPFSMGKGKNWSVLNPDVGAESITLNHGLHSPGHEFTQHQHDDSEDVIVVLEGEVQLRQGDVYTPLSAGEAAFIPAAEVHGTVNSSGETARLISFQLPPDLALYRGERNTSGAQTPRPKGGSVSAVQIVRMVKGSPRFPADPDVRNVFSPAKGAKYARLDYIILHPGQAYEYGNDNPESVFVLIHGKASVSQSGEDRTLSKFDVVFLKGKQSVTLRHAGEEEAILLCCSYVVP
ncbi:MAG: cupin domain-containing protein [Spirochaetaceae bacterium]|nr:MAG: cupin domain-containing protein [Spirochaetaceae bacterium]